MEQLFWQSNGNVCLGFGSLADNFLLFEHRQKSQEFTEIPFGQFRLNSNLRFLAKNSNARYTKSLRVSEKTVPSFLAKISNASQKSSPFLVWKEDLAFARTPDCLESSRKGGSGDRKGRPYAGSVTQAISSPLRGEDKGEGRYGKIDKNKMIY